MKKFVFAALVLWSSLALSLETMVCTQYGHTDNPEEFHTMERESLVTVFITSPNFIAAGDEQYNPVDPEDYDMKGLANTYLSSTKNKILYLYTNEYGEKEIGISRLEDGTDTLFKDKSVFAKCSILERGSEHVASSATPAVERRGTVDPRQVYRF